MPLVTGILADVCAAFFRLPMTVSHHVHPYLTMTRRFIVCRA
jgi:hypothetical protein